MIKNITAEQIAVMYGNFVKAKEIYCLRKNEDNKSRLLTAIENCEGLITQKRFPHLYQDLMSAKKV